MLPDRPGAAWTATSSPQGSVRIRSASSRVSREFLEAMRDADIIHKHKNLIYVQALKFLQTAGRQRRRR